MGASACARFDVWTAAAAKADAHCLLRDDYGADWCNTRAWTWVQVHVKATGTDVTDAGALGTGSGTCCHFRQQTTNCKLQFTAIGNGNANGGERRQAPILDLAPYGACSAGCKPRACNFSLVPVLLLMVVHRACSWPKL